MNLRKAPEASWDAEANVKLFLKIYRASRIVLTANLSVRIFLFITRKNDNQSNGGKIYTIIVSLSLKPVGRQLALH